MKYDLVLTFCKSVAYERWHVQKCREHETMKKSRESSTGMNCFQFQEKDKFLRQVSTKSSLRDSAGEKCSLNQLEESESCHTATKVEWNKALAVTSWSGFISLFSRQKTSEIWPISFPGLFPNFNVRERPWERDRDLNREIPYWWRSTKQINFKRLLIGCYPVINFPAWWLTNQRHSTDFC